MNQIYLKLFNGRERLADYDGNPALFKLQKVAFLSSNDLYPQLSDVISRWIVKVKREKRVIVSGFMSAPERLVLSLAIKENLPVIAVLNRGLSEKIPKDWETHFNNGKMARVTVFNEKITVPSEASSFLRNQLVIDMSDSLTVGNVKKGGKTDSLLKCNESRTFLNLEAILYNKN